jgi:hypothetical protein
MSAVGWSYPPICDAGSRCAPVTSCSTLRLQSRRSAAHALIGLAGRLEHSAVDDLRDDRRRDAATDTPSA